MPRMTIHDLGYSPGQLPTGPKNSILDVAGVQVGQETVGEDGDPVRNGVTVILPRHPDDIHIPCYAGMHTLNGNGEVSGSYQIQDWGFTNTPIALTNSTSFGTAFQGTWNWTLAQAKCNNKSADVMSHDYGTPIVGETADWYLNDLFSSTLSAQNVETAFARAVTGTEEVQEGQCGGGAGMTCHMFPGGTGTSSRVVKGDEKEGNSYTVGVLVQSNYGHTFDLQIAGVPVGKLLLKEREVVQGVEGVEKAKAIQTGGKADEGSIVIILITDAPMLPHQLSRLARHCAIGLAQVGGHGVGRNFSGDIILALSTANWPSERVLTPQVGGIAPVECNAIRIVRNESVDTMFRAASEATEEAVLNSMVAGRQGRTGFEKRHLPGLPVQRVRELLGRYRVVV